MMTTRGVLDSALFALVLLVLDVVRLGDAIKLTPIMWKSANPMFRIDNTNHVKDVAIGDMVDVICPQYPLNTPQHLIEQHVLYQVTKAEYDACEVNYLDPRVTRQILKCTNPFGTEFLTIVFREYTPMPKGLEFKRGQDYYYISTSTGQLNGIYNKQGGACRNNNMRMIFKVCCNNEASQPDESYPGADNRSPASPDLQARLHEDLAAIEDLGEFISDELSRDDNKFSGDWSSRRRNDNEIIPIVEMRYMSSSLSSFRSSSSISSSFLASLITIAFVRWWLQR